ncbi:uncharacterized protein LOC123659446 [Melitaea cinxia]|uniref:uncharacterized protein LOC123659446 n=1 Tax=Melitaea cinxia TaxID=113334 RepID=UPI001E272BB2|nr:uncharacterized protein LOC123659446 [Melitaea cinxia]
MSLKSLSKELQDSIDKIIEKEKYKKYDIAVKKFETHGNNFLGGLYEIDITGETTEGKKNTNVFVKQQNPMEYLKLLPLNDLYLNEVFIYNDLSKVFTTLQDEANVPQDERFIIAKAYEETNNNQLILENLSKKGFRTYGKLEDISIKYAQLSIQQMAKFHALSFDGDAAEVIPIDYQFINYGCPVMDFLLFIFTSTDREFRKKHLNDLKELYFETLSSFLKYFNMDVEAVYPRKEFEKVYTEWLDFGLMMTLFYSYVLFAPDTGIDLGKVPVSELPICPDKKYDVFYRGLIDDFVEWGHL